SARQAGLPTRRGAGRQATSCRGITVLTPSGARQPCIACPSPTYPYRSRPAVTRCPPGRTGCGRAGRPGPAGRHRVRTAPGRDRDDRFGCRPRADREGRVRTAPGGEAKRGPARREEPQMTAEVDVLVLGGAGVDTIVHVPELPVPFADSLMIRPG